MSDEDDYMSEEILNACAKNDVRPGLLHKHGDKRIHTMDKRKAERDAESRQPKKGRLEAERREQGLQQPISQDNKGFALLQKMGYKAGSSLGKSSSEGRLEPVAVVLKTDRGGLGREAALREVRQRKEELLLKRLQPLTTDSVNNYRNQLSSKFSGKLIGRDLRLSQITCHNLDTTNGVESPPYPWFWRQDKEEKKKEETDEEEEPEEEEEEEEEEQLEPEDQLDMLTMYLRKSYFYCIWCGTQYEDDEDLQQECPGNTRNDH